MGRPCFTSAYAGILASSFLCITVAARPLVEVMASGGGVRRDHTPANTQQPWEGVYSMIVQKKENSQEEAALWAQNSPIRALISHAPISA
jgi:hypothetical protein